MYLSVKRSKGKQYFSFMESYRENGCVKKRVIVNLGNYEKALRIIKSDYPEFLSDLDSKFAREVVPTEVVPTEVVPTKEVFVPANLNLCDVSKYNQFDYEVIALFKDTRGTRFILKRDEGYIQSYVYDDYDVITVWDKPLENRYKRHWSIERWSWKSIEDYKSFMVWYEDLLT